MNRSAHDCWMQAEAAIDAKNFAKAETLFLEAIRISPGHLPSSIGLSTVLSKRGAHREAHRATLNVIRSMPEHPALVFALGQRLRYFHEFEALERVLSSPLLLEAPPDVLAKSVVMLSSINANDSAMRLAEAGLLRHPNHAALLYVRGNQHFFDGDQDDAERCYEAALMSDPRLFQASWMMASVRTQTPEKNHLNRLVKQLATATPGREGEAYLCYGLHKELHDLKDYEAAWDVLSRGCKVKRKLIEYNQIAVDELSHQLRAVCTPRFFEIVSNITLDAVPIFIVGMHRSGTTLLERMLSGHPDVGDAGETRSFDAQLELAADQSLPNGISAAAVACAKTADFDQIANDYSRHTKWLSRNKPFFTEKLPMNFWNVGFIAKALPQARIIHLIRDPLDTCFSNLRTLFAGVATYSYDQEELATFYLQYRNMMAYWSATLPETVLNVAYDDLVSDSEATLKRVTEHCGLRWIDGLSDVSRPGGRVSTASAGLARQGVLKNRGKLWRDYEAHLGVLKARLEPLYR